MANVEGYSLVQLFTRKTYRRNNFQISPFFFLYSNLARHYHRYADRTQCRL